MSDLQKTGLNLLVDIGQKLRSLPQEKLEKMIKALGQLASGSFDFLVIRDKELSEIGESFFINNPHSYIVIVGYTKVLPQKIWGMAKQIGIPKDNIRLHLDYDNKNFPFKVCENPKCVGVIIGPTQHKVKDNDSSSPASELRERLMIPLIEMRQNGEPKISKTALRQNLRSLLVQITNNLTKG